MKNKTARLRKKRAVQDGIEFMDTELGDVFDCLRNTIEEINKRYKKKYPKEYALTIPMTYKGLNDIKREIIANIDEMIER